MGNDGPFTLSHSPIQFVGKEIDESYVNAVSGVSLSEERGANVMYSPLHGCGLTSVYPVLQHLGFNVKLDPKTSNMSFFMRSGSESETAGSRYSMSRSPKKSVSFVNAERTTLGVPATTGQDAVSMTFST